MTVDIGARDVVVAYARTARTVVLLRTSSALVATATVLHNAGVALAERVPGAIPPLRILRDGDTTERTFRGLGLRLSSEMAEHADDLARFRDALLAPARGGTVPFYERTPDEQLVEPWPEMLFTEEGPARDDER